jgi:hypothetical protein
MKRIEVSRKFSTRLGNRRIQRTVNMPTKISSDKSHRGNASQFFVAGELCRRGFMAVVTMGNCPNTDVLCSNKAGTKFVHIQVKTFVPGNKTCSVGMKAANGFGESFFWVLAGIPEPNQKTDFIYFIIPASEMAEHTKADFDKWVKTPGLGGRLHDTIRTVTLPPRVSLTGWDVNSYKNCWGLIEDKLK